MYKLIIVGAGEDNRHFLLSILVKHLDHKNVLKFPSMQLDIVEVTTRLTRQTKVQCSAAIVGAVSDIMRHLRKAIHSSFDHENLGDDVINWNIQFLESVDECLVQLSYKVSFIPFLQKNIYLYVYVFVCMYIRN